MDWADEKAVEVQKYLRKCSTSDEELELIAAYLRASQSEGKVIATKECGDALGITLSEIH